MKMLRMNQSAPCNFYHPSEQGKSLDDYKHNRLYSHIIDEYDFKINNKLMVQKIINPRRDKTIMDSLIHASPKYALKKKKLVPATEKQQKDRRITLSRKLPQRSLICNTKLVQTQYALKKTKRSNFGPGHQAGTALENSVEYSCWHQAKENIFQAKYLETRDCSLRNNFVGRIVKNSQRQYRYQDNETHIQNQAAKAYGSTVQNLVCGESLDKHSQGETTEKKEKSVKHNYRKVSHNKRLLLRQTLKEHFDTKVDTQIN